MRLARPVPRQAPENVVPLINVVFLLLIFFVLTSAFIAPSPFELEPPRAGALEAAPEDAREVALAMDGRLALDGEAMERGTLLKRLSTAPGPVVLLAGAKAESGEVLALLEDLRTAGVTTVLLRGQER